MDPHTVVVGIGSPFGQDDRAGLTVIEQLELAGLDCRTAQAVTAGFEVLDKIRGYRRAIVVDACQLGREPGTILEGTADILVAAPSLSNGHGIDLATTLKTGYLCFPEEMPADISILLIQVKALHAFTERMSPEVEAAVAEVVHRIRTRLLATG